MPSPRLLVALLALPFALGASSCASDRQFEPEPANVAVAAPAPVLPRSAPPISAAPAPGWEDAPLTPGDWTYADGRAAFAGDFAMRCDRAAGRVLLERAGASRLDVSTSAGAQSLPAPGGTAAAPSRDPFLDAIAFSRGRFAVASPGLPTLIVPAHAEPARVIEDCRAG